MTCPSASTPAPAASAFPSSTANPPNLPAISYRIGDFLRFRDALLRGLPGETELKDWKPSADGDLALQLLEWWAYVGDVLTFYNERIANENYVRTAQLPESVNHLVETLGYRPRPALGSRGRLTALLSPGARPPVQVPAGLQVQSKPGPGATPQVFEVDQNTNIGLPDRVLADVDPADKRLVGPGQTLWLAGKVSGVKAGDRLMLVTAATLSEQTLGGWSWIRISSVSHANDPLGAPVTQLGYVVVSGPVAAGAQAPDYLLLRPRQSSPLWSFSAGATPISDTAVSLAGLARGISAGNLVLLDAVDGAGQTILYEAFEEMAFIPFQPSPQDGSEGQLFFPFFPTAVIATGYAESVGYPEGRNASPPMAVPFASISYDKLGGNFFPPPAGQVTVRWDWLEVGTLVPVLTLADYLYAAGATLLASAASGHPFPALSTKVLLEDSAGRASSAVLTGAEGGPGAPSSATLGPLDPPPPSPLASPIEAFFNLVGVSRGKTVPNEVLGSGDPRIAAQEFTLAKSPVTYFADPASISGEGFSSTVQVSVNGVQWREVQSFFGQAPNAQVFLLREDDNANTHVVFGDGVNGARPPTGVNNIVATYRYGAGGAAPAAEALTNVMTPAPGLKGFRNPSPPTGGADADPPWRLRTLAPRSVLTLGRVVSIDDFAAVAATAGGVIQAAAAFAFDPVSQRPVTTVWVAGDGGAVTSARTALAGEVAPMDNVRVRAATPVEARLEVNYLRDPRYADADVRAALRTALVDPNAGLFAANAPRIGAPIYESQIAAACLAVPGVAAVSSLTFAEDQRFIPLNYLPNSPSPGVPASPRHDPGSGNYFVVPDDDIHFVLAGAAAT
jgi:hypothetical protein